MIDTLQLRLHGILAKKTGVLDLLEAEQNNLSDFVCYEHHELYKKMLIHKGRFFEARQIKTKKTTSYEVMDSSDFLHLENTNDRKAMTHVKNVMRFIDETEVREMTMRVTGKYSNPSSIAAVVFSINENGGFIDFTVSIPKYLYNHSLAEFVPQIQSNRYYQLENAISIKSQRKMIHLRLMKFINKFLSDLSQIFKLETVPNLNYIEIRRIDLCWNQHFNSKAEALTYLGHQQKLAKRKATHSNNKVKEYETSLNYFTSSGAFFKIYHKGSEYITSEFGDLKKHQDLNKRFLDKYVYRLNNVDDGDSISRDDYNIGLMRERLKDKDYVLNLFEQQIKGKHIVIDNEKLRKRANETAKLLKKIQPYKIHFLKDEMDKVLRYEISLRGDFFSYNYKRKIFRKNCPHYKDLMDNYKFVHSVRNSKAEKKPVLTKWQNKDYSKIHSFLNKSIGLVFSDDPMLKRFLKSTKVNRDSLNDNYNLKPNFYKETILSEKDVGIFCNDFLQLCFDYFFRTVKDFQIDKINNYDDIAEKIKQYNSEAQERKDNYDREYHFLTLDNHGKPIIKGKTLITKASQLLSLKQKHEKGMKIVQPLRIMQILTEIQKGKSLHLIRKELGISASNFSKIKKDLALFEIYENTLDTEMDFHWEISFRDYYYKTSGLEYQKNFYNNKKQIYYG
ncbi:hypothetical protein ACFSKN_02045 [Mariniflexile gromovii]|uniref:Uncharacterized protein n=1 Tax=Mariniflexile gromovii TaxID=362523 RepID=A0ABS4BPP2_9FLAO|nr:hypothetical protein [Mariniflexile gromovii]MBP0902383.1 hypothetical protein [Mariniflexile gromovii]